MLFPWYGFKLGSPLSATALDSFNLAHGALLLTAAAVVFVLASDASRRWPRPLSEAALIIVGGVWSALVVAFLIADPPDLLLGTDPIGDIRIRYGVFVAAGAAVAMVVGGIQARLEERLKPER